MCWLLMGGGTGRGRRQKMGGDRKGEETENGGDRKGEETENGRGQEGAFARSHCICCRS